MYDRQALIDLIKEQALEYGDFTLASGKKASFYLDCRRVTLDSRGAVLVAEGCLDLFDSIPDAVGGMAIGADPITAAIITLAGNRGQELKGFIVRKELKSHGKGQAVEGPVHPGQSVVIVEDVVTTGGSSLLAIERAEQFGLHVKEVVSVVDRLEGASDNFAQRGYPFRSLVTLKDLGLEPVRG